MFHRISKIRKNPYVLKVLKGALGLGVAFGISQVNVDYLDSITYDWRVQLLPDPPKTDIVHLTTITEKTIQGLGGHPTAKDHVGFLKSLKKQKPKVIIYAFDPANITGTFDELEEFAKMANSSNLILAARGLPPSDGSNANTLLPPLDQLNVISGPRTSDKVTFGKDRVTRRWIYKFLDMPLLHAQVVNKYFPELEPKPYRGLFPFKRTVQAFVEFRRQGAYPTYPFEAVAKNEISQGTLKDKLVIVGVDAKSSLYNYGKIPLSKDILAMSRAEIHANIFDTIFLNRSPWVPPKWFDLLITSLISVLTVFVVLSVRPTLGLMILGGTLSGFFLTCLMAIYWFQIRVGMAHPVLAIFVCYYFFIPYRLIMENRKSWEYYQRNNLLTQVEELKTNFLKMMSHDLKTPLARIQGMTDIVTQDPQASALSVQQKHALETINQSSSELSEFINSILSYGRIESKEIKLLLQSKDINKIMQTVVDKASFLAEEKNIQIITEFEPLFSVKLDPDLIRQVFTNLVENAIKYSPENTKILVSTEESKGNVLIQVADQGYGIPENEQSEVFSKFYRSKGATSSSINGSGLGLYLASYFVQLHRGSLQVESEVGEGSTFSVELPSELDLNNKPLGRS